MNLLKLPKYNSKELLRKRLIYAVEAEAGFELSWLIFQKLIYEFMNLLTLVKIFISLSVDLDLNTKKKVLTE